MDMSKKEKPAAVEATVETAPAVVAPSAVVLPPTAPKPSHALAERMAEVDDNMATVENFRLPRAKMTPAGIELMEGTAPILELEAVILHAKKTNVFYDKPYDPTQPPQPPTCFSIDGVKPDASVKTPVFNTCAGCPKAEFGTNAMGKGKACRNLKPLFLLAAEQAIIPRQLAITPINLKAANAYLLNLTERGINYRKIKTKISLYKDNPNVPYYRMKFVPGDKLDEAAANDVAFLRSKWLPIMENQSVDQNEIVDADAATEVPNSNGAF